MILKLFQRSPRDDSIAALYGVIVAQARQPAFYAHYGVPDTANGRLEMIILHAVLVLLRLQTEGGSSQRFGQLLFDHFCSDMDANLREMGVGDMAVPRKMKTIAEAFYGRKRAYQAAIAAPGLAALVAALVRNVRAVAADAPIDASSDAPSDAPSTCAPSMEPLALYMRAATRKLSEAEGVALLGGRVEFPDPQALLEPRGVGAA